MANPNRKEATPALTEVITRHLDKRFSDFHTCLPGKIESVDTASGTVDVQPLLKRKYIFDDEAVSLPVITSVPIVYPRFGESQIKFPIKKGDNCLLLFVERSIDIWFGRGGEVDPLDKRKGHLSDAICLPGLYPQTAPLAPTSEKGSMEIRNGKAPGGAVVEIGADGKFRIGNDVVELLQLMVDALDQITKNKTVTLLGPQTILPSDIVLMKAIETKLKSIKK